MSTIIVVEWVNLATGQILMSRDGTPARFEAANCATMIQVLGASGRWLPVGFGLWIERVSHRSGDSLEARMPSSGMAIRASIEEAR